MRHFHLIEEKIENTSNLKITIKSLNKKFLLIMRRRAKEGGGWFTDETCPLMKSARR
jgi:hypothetical protein